jgi:hypothetical protein
MAFAADASAVNPKKIPKSCNADLFPPGTNHGYFNENDIHFHLVASVVDVPFLELKTAAMWCSDAQA